MFSGRYGLNSLMQASNTNNNNPPHYVGRDSSVGIATRYGIGRSGYRIPGGEGARFSTTLQTGPGIHPASYTTGTGYFPG